LVEINSGEKSFEERKREFLGECIACGQCLENCRFFPSMKFAHLGAKELIGRILEVLGGGEISEGVYDTIYSCSACAECRDWCPSGIAPGIFWLMAEELTSRGQRAPEQLYYCRSVQFPYNYPHMMSALQVGSSSMRWLSKAPQDAKAADIVLYLGCVPTALSHLVFTLLDILKTMGLDFVVLGGGNNLCCGVGYLQIGDTDGAKRSFEESVSNIQAFSPKLVLFDCFACYARFAPLAQSLNAPFQCQYFVNFLMDNLDKLRFTKSLNRVITYHDDCATRVLQADKGDYEIPRELLRAIPGIRLVEMEHNKENSICCGGHVNWTYPEILQNAHKTRIEEAKTAGAEQIVTSCSYCYTTFTSLEERYALKATHLILLIGEAMGIAYENKLREYLHCADLNKIIDEAKDNLESNNLNVDEVKRFLPKLLKGWRVV